MNEEDLDLDMTFEEAAEFLERAGGTASTELLLEMLRDALAAIEGLSSRILSLELDRRSGHEMYGGLNAYPVPHVQQPWNGTGTGASPPTWGGRIYNGTYTSSGTDNTVNCAVPTVRDLMVRLNAVHNSVST